MNTRGDVAFFFVLLIYFVLFCSPSWFPVNTCRDIVSLSFFLFFIYIYIYYFRRIFNDSYFSES